MYLSGLRFTQIHLGGGNPFQNDAMPQLEYVLKGIKRVQARQAEPPNQRLTITGDIMRSLHAVWISEHPDPDNVMLWAAACVGFFGFLRAGEFTSPSANAFDPEVHLGLSDIALDSHTSQSLDKGVLHSILGRCCGCPYPETVTTILAGGDSCPLQGCM